MRRRSLLAVAGSALSLSGCLSDGSNGGEEPNGENESDEPDEPADRGESDEPNGTDESGESGSDEPENGDESDDPNDRRYEECPKEVIPYAEFPADVQTEIDVALDGEYEADRVYLAEAMDVDESYVSVDDAYYDPTIESDGDRETLTLQRVEPKALPRPRPVSVEQTRDGERTVTIEVVAEDGTVLLEESRELHSGGDVEFGRVRRVGTHELRITISEDGTVETEATETVRIDESHFDVLVVVEPGDVFVTGTVAELGECRYEE